MIKSELQLRRNPFAAVFLSLLAAVALLFEVKISTGGEWSVNLVKPFAGDTLSGFGWLLMFGGMLYLFISIFSFAKTALWLLLLPMGMYCIGTVLRAMTDSGFFICLAMAVIGTWAYFMSCSSEKDSSKYIFVGLLTVLALINAALCLPGVTKAVSDISSDFTPLLCYGSKDAAGSDVWNWNVSCIIHEICLFLSLILTLTAATRQYETDTEDSRKYTKDMRNNNTYDTEADVKKKRNQSESNEKVQTPSFHDLKKEPEKQKESRAYAESVVTPEPVVTVPISGSRLQKSLKEEIVYDRDQKLEHKNVVRVFSVIGMIISFLMMLGGILLLTKILPAIQYNTICGVLLITVGVGLFCVFGNNLTYKEYYMKTIVTERKVVHEETNWEEVLANRLEEDEKNIASLTETYARMTEMYGKLLESTAELSNSVKALGMKEQPVLTDVEAQRQAIEEAAAAERRAQEEMLAAQQAAAERIALEREALERAKAEREAIEKEAAARLVAEHEAIEREAARLAAEREALEREAEQRAMAERARIEKEALEMAEIEREAAERIHNGQTFEAFAEDCEQQPANAQATPNFAPQQPFTADFADDRMENPTFDLFADVTINKDDETEGYSANMYGTADSTDVEEVLSDAVPDTFEAYVESVTSTEDDTDFPDTKYQEDSEELAEDSEETTESFGKFTKPAFFDDIVADNMDVVIGAEAVTDPAENVLAEEAADEAMTDEIIEQAEDSVITDEVAEETDNDSPEEEALEQTADEDDTFSDNIPEEPVYLNLHTFAAQSEYANPMPFHAPVKEPEVKADEGPAIEDIIPPIEKSNDNADLLSSLYGSEDNEERKPFFNNSFYASLADENPLTADNGFNNMNETDAEEKAPYEDKQGSTAFGFFSTFADNDTKDAVSEEAEEEIPDAFADRPSYTDSAAYEENQEVSAEESYEEKPVSTEREILEDFVLPTFRGFGFDNEEDSEEQQEEEEDFFKPGSYKMKSFTKKGDDSWKDDDDDDFGVPVAPNMPAVKPAEDSDALQQEPAMDEPELPMDDSFELAMDEPNLPMDDDNLFDAPVTQSVADDDGDRLKKLQAKLAEIRQKNSEKYGSADAVDDLDE